MAALASGAAGRRRLEQRLWTPPTPRPRRVARRARRIQEPKRRRCATPRPSGDRHTPVSRAGRGGCWGFSSRLSSAMSSSASPRRGWGRSGGGPNGVLWQIARQLPLLVYRRYLAAALLPNWNSLGYGEPCRTFTAGHGSGTTLALPGIDNAAPRVRTWTIVVPHSDCGGVVMRVCRVFAFAGTTAFVLVIAGCDHAPSSSGSGAHPAPWVLVARRARVAPQAGMARLSTRVSTGPRDAALPEH